MGKADVPGQFLMNPGFLTQCYSTGHTTTSSCHRYAFKVAFLQFLANFKTPFSGHLQESFKLRLSNLKQIKLQSPCFSKCTLSFFPSPNAFLSLFIHYHAVGSTPISVSLCVFIRGWFSCPTPTSIFPLTLGSHLVTGSPGGSLA